MNNDECPPGRRQERLSALENRRSGIYGDHIKQKKGGMFRILFQNPQGLGKMNREGAQSLKLIKIKNFLLKQKVDVLGLAEINRDWRMIPQAESLWQATEGWFEYRRLSTSINHRVAPRTQVQYGGTALMATNRVAYSIISTEDDPRRLGRWTSFLFRGKNQKLCRVICAYCPCRSTGHTSTYALQVVGLAQDKIWECPRKQFWTDLKDFITMCQAKNEQVVIMGDWNSRYSSVTQWMESLDLTDILQSRHNSQTPPPTCYKSTEYPIDAIFAPSQFKCWRGGYLSYDILSGDHRGIWCDIPMEYILGYKMQHPSHAKARRLKARDPTVRKRYLTLLHRQLALDHVYERIDNLRVLPGEGLLPTDILQFEAIDQDITRAMEQAENKCRKLCTGEIKWSPLYQKACDRVTYWTLLQKEHSGLQINKRKLISLRKKLGFAQIMYTDGEIEQSLHLAKQQRLQCKKRASELQMEYRYRLAKALEESDNIPAATHIRNLTHQENTRALFRRIRYLERKFSNLSTSRVTISLKHGRVKELVLQQEVEKCILYENEKKYHQTEGTGQLQKGRLLKDFGTMGEGSHTESLLQGIYHAPVGTSQATKKFLRIMKRPDGVKVVPPITFREFCQGWARAKERTSSNGPHFGHYKSAMHHPNIAQLLYKRAIIPMVTGYSPRRHRHGIDVMLLKKENNYNVDRLRTIVLFDSEANMNYKHLGRRAMKAALQHNQIATEQYSRPYRKSIDHALNRRLVMDHQLYRRRPFAITSCDLKSCYDRINHTSASMALQRIGIPRSEVLSMFTSIQYMTHRVRTAFGDSNTTYGGLHVQKDKWKLPPQGVLQGNGSGPAIWSILSSCLFHILRKNGHYNTFQSAVRNVLLKLSGFAYVDDTDLLQVHDSVEEVVRQMQQTLTEWNNLVGVTGGILEPAKCWWYLVTFQYTAGKWKAVAPLGDFRLWLKDAKNQKVALDSMDPSIGINMLGVHLAPDGNSKDHVQALRGKAEKWVSNMQLSRANTEEVWTALHRTIPFSICYSLPAVTLSRDECKYIMAPLTRYGLSRAGIVSTVNSAIRMGTISMGGLGIVDPYIYMGVSQIENFLSNTWQNTPTGQLQEITLDDFALELGLPMPWSRELLKKGIKYAKSDSWIRHMVQFSVENDIWIDFRLEHLFQPQRINDKTIMELAVHTTNIVSRLYAINNVRMALNVIWISDIMTADGRGIDEWWLFPKQYARSRNGYLWPAKHHVTAKDWGVWRQWLREICDMQVVQPPLGVWTSRQSDWTNTWESFVTQSTELLYTRSGCGWTRHIRNVGRQYRRLRYYIDSIYYDTLPETPDNLKRVTCSYRPTYIEVTSSGHPPMQWQQAPPQYIDYWGQLQATPQTLRTVITNVLKPFFLDFTADIDLLVRDFTRGTIVAVSDGSYYRDQCRAAAAWLIESECGTQWIMGSLFVPGSTTDYSSYRSELTGLLALSVTLKTLARSYSQPQYVIVGCDGKSALQTLTQHRHEINANSPNADLISILIDIWTSSTMKPFPVHVKGHQDQCQHNLTRLERMNVIVDRLATMTAECQSGPVDRLKIPFMGIRGIEYQGNMVSGTVHKRLYNGLVDSRLHRYYENKLFTPPITISHVDISAFHHARNSVPSGINKFISKWLSNTLPTGKVLQTRQHRIFNRCPRCNAWGEDNLHILICWDIRADLIRKVYLQKLQTTLQRITTHPEIIQFLLSHIQLFFKKPSTILAAGLAEDWQVEQQNIGWYNFFSGFISQELVAKQQRHYQDSGLRNKGRQWASKIIIQNWQLIRQLWLCRNEVLHQKHIINSLSGQALLDIEIERLYDLGWEDLPAEAQKWFRVPKVVLLEQSIEQKKGWLLIIRTIRESLNIAGYSIFSSSKSMRNWVGLNKNI